MTSPKHRSERGGASAFQFRLDSLFLAMAVCAVLLALYSYFGNVLLSVLVVAALALGGLTWIIDALALMKSYISPSLNREPGPNNVEPDRFLAREELVDDLRRLEVDAAARYDASGGALEDVLHARAARLKAEIDLLRERESSKQSQAPLR